MKLAMTTGSLSRDAGGLFESVRAMGKALQDIGMEVAAYGLWDKNWQADESTWLPLKAQAFRYHGPRAIAWSPAMNRALETNRSDVLHLNGLWQYSSIATHSHWRKWRTPYVISPRGMMDQWALANSRWKKMLAAFVFEKAVLRDAACIHALCLPEADSIRAYGLRQRIEVVPNGVELPEKLTTEDTERTEGKNKLLFLGRIHPKKGLVGLIRAWADIQNSKSNIQNAKLWQLVIAGWDQGGHEAELVRLCEELGLEVFSSQGSVFSAGDGEDLKLNSYKLNTLAEGADVVFWGAAFGAEKEALLRSVAAFVLPSFSEGLPMSVLEAWAYGLPVVMTPECNLQEGFAAGAALEIRNGEMGGAHREGLRVLLEMTDAQRSEMGRRGRRLVEDKFTWPKVAAQMKEIFEGLT